MKVLVTGVAGFVGYFTACKLLNKGIEVIGIDNINSYYDINLKLTRLGLLGIEDSTSENKKLVSKTMPGFSFIKLDLAKREELTDVFRNEKFSHVCHLAAQAGVRYSLENPYAYIDSNISAFMNILENCRAFGIEHLVYASSSSVYGLNESMPYKTTDNVDHPISLYAATKKSNELMAHTYSHLYGIPATALRFFTVYGPLGRPDMAYFLFTKAIFENKPLNIYNNGDMLRDFTYIDDIVEGIMRVIDKPPVGNKSWSGQKPDPSCSVAPYKIYNIGNSSPVKLMDFVEAIEQAAGRTAEKNYMPMQLGDIYANFADISDLTADTGYRPSVSVNEGVERFVAWYKQFYNIK